MKKTYHNFEEIDKDLRILNLKQQIALEEMKVVKNDLESYFKPSNWLKIAIKIGTKYGALYALKKIIK